MKPEIACDSLRIPLEPGMHLQRGAREGWPLPERYSSTLGVTAC
ncbi:hypothetical protein [Geomonas azotofigens]|nr:hypothetical protein [Geomonas azotofigens]